MLLETTWSVETIKEAALTGTMLPTKSCTRKGVTTAAASVLTDVINTAAHTPKIKAFLKVRPAEEDIEPLGISEESF